MLIYARTRPVKFPFANTGLNICNICPSARTPDIHVQFKYIVRKNARFMFTLRMKCESVWNLCVYFQLSTPCSLHKSSFFGSAILFFGPFPNACAQLNWEGALLFKQMHHRQRSLEPGSAERPIGLRKCKHSKALHAHSNFHSKWITCFDSSQTAIMTSKEMINKSVQASL